MAHFAELDSNNLVLRIVVISNNDVMENGVESEAKGIAICQNLFGANTKWVKTSYNNNIRKNYAGIGYTYDPTNDWFHAPQPYPSWTLDANAQWQPPTPLPSDDGTGTPPKRYKWDEPTKTWIAVVPKSA
jgi:hypothetical protein